MEIGIIGLPNVGKSTLFNALLKKQVAYAANFPFATIEPNIGVVPVPDERLDRLAEVIERDLSTSLEMTTRRVPRKPATVKFVDIAGLVKGASQGEGLGNKFLSHIREVDAILYLLRDFADENVIRAGSESPEADLEVLRTELILADLETANKIANSKSQAPSSKQVLNSNFQITAKKVVEGLGKGMTVLEMEFSDKEKEEVRQMGLLTAKPAIVVLNVDEKSINNAPLHPPLNLRGGNSSGDIPVPYICAKMEEELAALTEEEQKEYLKNLGVEKSGLEKVIQEGFRILGLQTFLTAGEIEARAWTIKRGTKAPQAAGVIHTDFEKNFIKADCVNYADFVACGGWTAVREAGKVRQEGREYVMQENDVVEFKIGS